MSLCSAGVCILDLCGILDEKVSCAWQLHIGKHIFVLRWRIMDNHMRPSCVHVPMDGHASRCACVCPTFRHTHARARAHTHTHAHTRTHTHTHRTRQVSPKKQKNKCSSLMHEHVPSGVLACASVWGVCATRLRAQRAGHACL